MNNIIEDLRELCRTLKTPDDIIKGILANMETDFISKDPVKIHNVIYNLKDNEEYKVLLEPFEFDESGITPFSVLLDQVLFRLEASCLLGTLNPKYERYEIKTKREYFKRSIDKFNESEKEIIKNMSRRFEELMDIN